MNVKKEVYATSMILYGMRYDSPLHQLFRQRRTAEEEQPSSKYGSSDTSIMSSINELDPPSITECSTASIESGSTEKENTCNSNTVKNNIHVHLFKEILNPSTQKSKCYFFTLIIHLFPFEDTHNLYH